MSTVEGRQKVWRTRTSTHPVRHRTQAPGVDRCRSAFRMGGPISPRQNPAYCPSSAHLLYPQGHMLGAEYCVLMLRGAKNPLGGAPTFCRRRSHLRSP